MSAFKVRVPTVILLLATVSGCASKTPRSEAEAESDYATWYTMRYQPIAALPSPWETAMGKQTHAEAAASKPDQFRTVSRVGPYTLYNNKLLCDAKGKPVWAGASAVPARAGGKVTSLLLLADHESQPWTDDALMHIWRLDFSKPQHTLQYIQEGYMPMSTNDKLDWLMDIDGDGTDELLLVAPAVGPQGLSPSMPTIEWNLILYHVLLRPTPDTPAPIMNLACYLPLPKGARPTFVICKQRPGSVEVSLHQPNEKTSTQIIAKVRRDKVNGAWHMDASQ